LHEIDVLLLQELGPDVSDEARKTLGITLEQARVISALCKVVRVYSPRTMWCPQFDNDLTACLSS